MSAQVKLAIRNRGISARLAATRGTAGASQSDRGDLALVEQAAPPRPDEPSLPNEPAPPVPALPRRPSPYCLQEGSTRPRIPDIVLQLRRPPQTLSPVLEEVGVRPDQHRNLNGNSVQHGSGPVQMAKTVTGHVDGQSSASPVGMLLHRALVSPSETKIRPPRLGVSTYRRRNDRPDCPARPLHGTLSWSSGPPAGKTLAWAPGPAR